MGRATQGVRLINLRGKDEIASVAKVERSDDEDDEPLLDEEGNPIEPIADAEIISDTEEGDGGMVSSGADEEE